MNNNLIPIPGQQKDFYGKAYYVTSEIEGHKAVTLYSYGTPVLRCIEFFENGMPHWYEYAMWDNWSTTTGRHIQAFMYMFYPCTNHNKKWYDSIPVYSDDIFNYMGD